MVIFLWITPIPPSRAIAIAIRDSVTVSIAAVISGMLRLMSFVSFVFRETPSGVTSDFAGMSNTSSKVSPSFTNFSLYSFITTSHIFAVQY